MYGPPIARMSRDIPSGSAHVWCIALKSDTARAQRFCLDREELRRAGAFKFEDDRRRFITAHVALRNILGKYCGLNPADVPLHLGTNGKPSLPATYRLGFNLSHSADTALLAVGCELELGVDLERIHALADALALAERHFSTSERTRLRQLAPGAARDRAFLQCWTRKEAFAKSSGIGLRADLRAIDVGFDGRVERDGTVIQPLDAGPEFVAALAVSGPLSDVTRFEFVA